MTKKRVITVAGDVDVEASVAGSLTARHDVEVVLRCVDRVEVLAAIEGGSLDGAVVVGVARWLDRHTIEKALRSGIAVLGIPVTSEDVTSLGELGCDVVGIGATTQALLERLRRPTHLHLPDRVPERPLGRAIAVWGPKGAPGRTRIAIELAYMAGTTGIPTALLDADLFGGDVAQLLGLPPDAPGLSYLSRHVDELDSLDGPLPWATVVAGIVDPGTWRDVTRTAWLELLTAVREAHSLTVCDIGSCLEAPPERALDVEDRSDVALATVAEADQVVAVFRGDPVGVKHLLWGWSDLRKRFDPSQAFLVANQVAPGDARALRLALERHLGRGPDAIVPARPERVAEAVRRGKPVTELGPSSEVTRALESIAERLGVKVAARGVLARLGGRA